MSPAGTVVCDVVLFNAATGHLLAVEAKSGANIEPEQAKKLAAVDPRDLIVAAGITVPRPAPFRCEPLFACLGEHSERITRGLEDIALSTPVLAVGEQAARLVNASSASDELAAALREPTAFDYPIAAIIRFDHQSPDGVFDEPVQAELIAEMAQGRPAVTVRALAERVVTHFPLYGHRARSQLVRKVTNAARRAAAAEPNRLRFEAATGRTEARVAILQSPEEFDRRGRTQGYQAIFAGRGRGRPQPQIPGQGDLFSELDEAERAAIDETYESDERSSDNAANGKDN